MIIDPLAFLRLLSSTFLLGNEVSELVISHDEGIELLSVRDRVRVVVILRRSFDDKAFVSQRM